MLNAFSDLLCSKLCWHNRLVPTTVISWIARIRRWVGGREGSGREGGGVGEGGDWEASGRLYFPIGLFGVAESKKC